MKTTRSMICVSVLFVISLCFAGHVMGKDMSKGEAVFRGNCTMCHLILAENPPISAFYREFRPKDFTTPEGSKDLSEEKIKSVLTYGQGNMRPIKLSSEDYKALVDYLINDLKKKNQ